MERGKFIIRCAIIGIVMGLFLNNISNILCNSGLSSDTAPPIDYYISAAGGGDGLSSGSPTNIAGISSLNLQVRCNLNFNRGDIFAISLTIVNANITIQDYGTGAKPIFTGSTDISGLIWTNEGDGTYSTPMAQPNWIYINGLQAKCAETPWITITSYPAGHNQFGINNADVAGYGTITGSNVIFLAAPYATEYLYNITNYNSGTGIITINQVTVQTTNVVGQTIKLLLKKAYITATNDWAWEGGKLYIKTAVSPATMNIRQSTYNIGITIASGCKNITVKNIELTDYYYSGIYRNNANNLTLDSCDIHNSTGYAYAGIGNPLLLNVVRCNIYDSNGGIYDVATGTVNIGGTSISGQNIVYNIGMSGNFPFQIDHSLFCQQSGKGIYCINNTALGYYNGGGLMAYNKVYNIASIGMQMLGNYKVHHNILYSFMMRFSDGGGIDAYAEPSHQNNSTEIYNNILYNTGNTNVRTRGIYLDTRNAYFNVHDNVIYDIADAGININWDSHFHNIHNNIIVNTLYGIRFSEDNHYTQYQYNQGHTLTTNIFGQQSPSQFCTFVDELDAETNFNPFLDNGNSNSNYYINPYTTTIATHTQQATMTLAQVRARYGLDSLSTARVNWKAYVNPTQASLDVKLYTNETGTDVIQAVGAGYIDVNGNTVTQVTVPAYGGIVVLLYP